MNNAVDMVKCYEMLRSELKVKDLEAVMRGNTWARAMGLMADKFNSISARANSESDVATQIDAEILAFSHNVLEPSGRKGFDLKKERKVQIETQEVFDTDEVQRSSAIGTIGKNGRIDSKYSSVVIEYKQKVTYKNNADTNKALAQAVDYLNSLFNENAGTYLGIITDGTRCQFVLFNEQIKVAYDKDHSDIHPLTAVCDLNAKMVDRMIRAIINLQVKALNSENLITDLVHDKHDGKTIVNHLTIALYKSLEQMNNVTTVSYGQWMNNFGLSHDDASKQKAIEDRRKDLAELIEREKIGTDEEYKILFSLQTAIAILAMLMAYRVVILVKGQRHASFQSLLEMKIDQKRIELGKIAEGTVSMELNIFNLLETGCFSWPFQETHWTEEINNCVNDIIETLMRYETMPELNTRFDDNSELVSHTDDLFRDLYMNIMPPSVRHSLGEYYTPEFLAENVIDTGLDYIPFDKEHIRVELESFDSTRSKIKVGKRTPELETKYLRPLVKGINISRFHVDPSEFIVAFPYDEEHSQVPLSKEELLEESPKLLKYYETNKEYLTVQTEYSDKIIGKKEAPYYALARTGIYSHADWYVIFRDNTKWVAAVSGKINTEWGGIKKPAFQNHCVSVCQRADGSFITEDEAHYLCAILNSHIVEDYILSTSDKRTFKIRIPVRIMEYDVNNEIHVQLAELSKAAHEKYADLGAVEKLRDKIDKLYLQSLS